MCVSWQEMLLVHCNFLNNATVTKEIAKVTQCVFLNLQIIVFYQFSSVISVMVAVGGKHPKTLIK